MDLKYYCNYCGSLVDDSYIRCQSCGAPVSSPATKVSIDVLRLAVASQEQSDNNISYRGGFRL